MERAFYAGLALLLAGTCYYLARFSPVAYTHLVTEDRFGEWFTAIAYGAVAPLLWFMAWKFARGVQRSMWSLIGLTAFLLAGEEISWGQRLFNLRTPESMVDLNMQAEMNLHNLAAFGAFNSTLHDYVAMAIFGWIALCAVTNNVSVSWHNKMISWGVPLFPTKLLPLLLLPALTWSFIAMPKQDETGEFLLSLAVIIWAFDIFITHSPLFSTSSSKTRLAAMLALLLALGAITQVFCWKRGGDLGYRFNGLAADFYPQLGWYDQAETLFRHIEANPQYLSVDTRINHGRMLMQWGKTQVATEVLNQAQQIVDNDTSLSPALRALRNGSIAQILGNTEKSRSEFARAVELIHEQSEATADPAEKVRLLFQEAKVLEAGGNIPASNAKTEDAKALAKTHHLKINRLK